MTGWDRFLKADAKEISVRTNVSLITFLLVLEICLHNKNVTVDKTEIQPEMEWELALDMGGIMDMWDFISLFLHFANLSSLLLSFLIKLEMKNFIPFSITPFQNSQNYTQNSYNFTYLEK